MDLAKPDRYGAENDKIPERYVACICKRLKCACTLIPILLMTVKWNSDISHHDNSNQTRYELSDFGFVDAPDPA